MTATGRPGWPLFDLRIATPDLEIRPMTEADLPERVDHRLLSGELAAAREEKHGGTENLKNPGNRHRCARSCSRQRCCRCCRHDLPLRDSVDCRYMNFRPKKRATR